MCSVIDTEEFVAFFMPHLPYDEADFNYEVPKTKQKKHACTKILVDCFELKMCISRLQCMSAACVNSSKACAVLPCTAR